MSRKEVEEMTKLSTKDAEEMTKLSTHKAVFGGEEQWDSARSVSVVRCMRILKSRACIHVCIPSPGPGPPSPAARFTLTASTHVGQGGKGCRNATSGRTRMTKSKTIPCSRSNLSSMAHTLASERIWPTCRGRNSTWCEFVMNSQSALTIVVSLWIRATSMAVNLSCASTGPRSPKRRVVFSFAL